MNNTETISIQRAVMRRVRFIHWMRSFVHGPVLKIVAVIAIGLSSTWFIEFSEVVRNVTTLHGTYAFRDFILGAVVNTEAVVQILAAGAVVFLALAGRDMIRGSSRFTLSAIRT